MPEYGCPWVNAEDDARELSEENEKLRATIKELRKKVRDLQKENRILKLELNDIDECTK